jgi:hypothetical protein
VTQKRDEWAADNDAEAQRKQQLLQLDMANNPEKYEERARNWKKNSLRRLADARANHRRELEIILKELAHPNCATCNRPLTVSTLAACVDLNHEPDESGLTILDSCESCVFKRGAEVKPIDDRFGNVFFKQT